MINIELQHLFIIILSLSLSGALVGSILLLIHPVTERAFSKKWNYYIWLLLVVRLTLPINFEWLGLDSIKLNIDLLQIENTEAGVGEKRGVIANMGGTLTDSLILELEGNDIGIAPELSESVGLNDETGLSGSTAVDAPTVPIESGLNSNLPLLSSISNNVAKRSFAPINIIAAIWLAGVIIALSIKLCKYFYFINNIKNNSTPCMDRDIYEATRELSGMLNISKVPMVYESDVVSTAITVGLFRPIIILSKEERAASELKLILHHEYVHIIRKDLWYKWVYQILLCIHWFNALLYLIDRRIKIDCELSCDEAVLNYLSKEGMKIYGNLLLNYAQKNVAHVKNEFSTTFMSEKNNLKKRLKGIISYKQQSVFRVCISTCLLICMLFLGACGCVRFETADIEEAGDISYDIADNMAKVAEIPFDIADSVYGEIENSFKKGAGTVITNMTADSFLLRGEKVNKLGAAWKVYDDDNLIAGDDLYDQWSAYNYCGGNKITASGFRFNGSSSERIIYASDDIDISIDSEFELKDGKFKIVYISPDGAVSTINENGEKTVQTLTMEKGRNIIKFVGQGARIRELSVNFTGLDEKSFDKIYYSKDEEHADTLVDELKTGNADKDTLLTYMYLMEETEVSEAFKLLLNQGVSFNSEELCDVFVYSDTKLSGKYLVEAIENGVRDPLSVDELSEIIPYLDGEVKLDLIRSLPDCDFFDALEGCAWYLTEDELEQCMINYLYEGGTMSYSEFKIIAYYLDDDSMKRIDKYIQENR
ncbi:MAG: M56 family metallopeptidase [Lachnospiraceae bacterium]|nr:M56 family metallopeptidase [Lachnospiraceae bacterium]